MIKTALKSVTKFNPAKFNPIDSIQGVRRALEKIEQQAKLHRHRIADFQGNVEFSFEKGHFSVKTASTAAELEQCLRLRFEVFHREALQKRRLTGVDVDKMDLICDHLIISDKRNGRVIGTYRLNCSKFTGQYYSADEFSMGKLLELSGHKLELGRACIDKDYRNGVVIALLWRGIAEYLQRTECSYLFGCASAKTTEMRDIALIHRRLLEQGLVDFSYDVEPTRKFKVKKLEQALEAVSSIEATEAAAAAQALIPALFTSYVKMGAKFLGEPALDRDFRCVDYLTLLKLDELNPLFSRKYKV